MNTDIIGSKKGGGGSAFYESDNTLQSTATVRVVEVVSEGLIKGLVDSGKSIYLNNTPIQNEDDTKNFGGKVTWDSREGTPDQKFMPGFPSASSEFNVGTNITFAAPVIYPTTSSNIDAVVVTISLPDGLASNNTEDNRLEGTSVELSVDTRLSAGVWTQVKTIKITGKSTGVYEESHRIERAEGTGLWDVRINRVTEDNQTAVLRNATALSRVTEVIDVKKSYPNVAYFGLSVDAKTVSSSSVPVRSYLIDGLIVKVPSNWNPVTKVYTGVWNGTFKNAWTDNPAWVLYDLIAHPRYGLGDWVTEDLIDKYSFYDAAVYNDGGIVCNSSGVRVSGGVSDGDGGFETRFTFNYQLMARQDASKWIQDIAGMMNAKVIWIGNKATLVQDRPASAVKLINTSNVVGGKFKYRSSTQQERATAVNVTWNNPNNYYQQEILTLDRFTTTGTVKTMLENATDRYGYNTKDVTALGCTRRSQAERAGLWMLDTVLNQTETVSFTQFLNGYDLFPGDVVEQFDENYAGVQQAGRLLANSTTTSIKLDRPVTITAGTTIKLLIGGDVVQKSVVQTSGTLSTVTITSALASAPPEYTDFIVTTTLSPRQFRITKAALAEDHTVNVEAVFHDPNKYARIEGGVVGETPIFSVVPSPQITAPRTLLFREVSVNEDNTITRRLNVSWQRPLTGKVVSYVFKWQVSSGGWQSIETATPSVEIPSVVPGLYEVRVYAVGYQGFIGTEATGSYRVSVSGGGASGLGAVTLLKDQNSGSTSFASETINSTWTNPISNGSVTSVTLRDFEVKVFTTDDELLRTEYIPGVPAGSTQGYQYTMRKNRADGGPRRSVKIQVRCRDSKNDLSAANIVTFTNATPAAPTSLTVTPSYGSLQMTWLNPEDVDLAGVMVWMSTTNGFTPSAANLVFDGVGNAFTRTGISASVWYYIKVGTYDTFAKSKTGSGMNLTGQAAGVTPYLPAGDISGQLIDEQIADAALTTAKFASGIAPVEIVDELPTTDNFIGRMVFLTTDGKLYRYTATGFTAAVPAVDVTGTLTNAQIADLSASKLIGTIVADQIADAALTTAKFAAGITPVEVRATLPTTGNFVGRTVLLTTDGKLYRSTGSGSTPFTAAVDGADITANSITAGQIAAGAINTSELAADAITAGKIAADAITSDKIAANAITAGKILAGSITGDKMLANTITALQISSGAITADEIAAGTITADEIAANTITGGKIAAGAIRASELAADAVLASKILVSDITNFFPDFDLQDPDLYTSNTAAGISFSNAASDNYGINYMLVAQSASEERVFTAWFKIEQATEYLISAPVHLHGAGTGTVDLYLQFGTVTAGVVSYDSQVLVGARTDVDSTSRFTISATSAANQKRARFRFTLSAGATAPGRTGAFRMQKKATGSLIVDGAITASKIVAETITGNEIAANTLTVGKLVLTDFSNFCANGNFELGGGASAPGWVSFPSTWSVGAKTDAGSTSYTNSPTTYMGRVTAAGANDGTIATPGYVSCKEGDKFYVSLSAAIVGGAPNYPAQDFRAVVNYKLSDGSLSGNVNFYFTTLTTAWETVSGEVTAPANAVGIRMRVWLNDSPSILGTISFTNAILRRKASAELLVDGSITANTLAAGSITASKMVLGAVTASRMQPVDTSNVWPDYDHADASFYSGTGYSIIASGSQNNGLYLINISTNAAARTVNSLWFNVEPGTEYRVDSRVSQATAETASTATASIEWGSMDSGGSVTVLSQSTIASRTDSTSSARQGSDIVSPSTARKARLVCTRSAGGAYAAYFGGLVMRRRATSALIVDGAITATKINVANLQAVSAQLGDVEVSTTGSLRSGQTAYNTNVGWWLGYASGVPKFSIGDPNGAHLKWTGTQLVVNATSLTIPDEELIVVGVKQDINKNSFVILGGGATAIASVSYTRAGSGWYTGGSSTVGDGYYIKVSKKYASSSALSSGTLDTWQQLSSNRTYSVSASSEIKEGQYQVKISTTASDAGLIREGGIFLNAESYSGPIP